MGAAVTGEFDNNLGPFSHTFICTRKRLDNALTLVNTIKTIFNTLLHMPKAYPLYIFANRVIAHALDYDACVFDPASLEGYATSLNDALITFVELVSPPITHRSLTPHQDFNCTFQVG